MNKVTLNINSHLVKVTENVIEKEVTWRFSLRGALGGQLPKGCRERKCVKSFVSFANRSPEVGVPIVGNVDLRFYVFVTRHVLWEEGQKEEVCGRWGARKIQIVIRWLGTGPLAVVKFAGQVLKFVWLKVKFG